MGDINGVSCINCECQYYDDGECCYEGRLTQEILDGCLAGTLKHHVLRLESESVMKLKELS